MAAKLMGQVWDLDLPHNEAWVLMALSDHADRDGNNVFPGLELLAYKTGYSERQLRRVLSSLEERGVIIPVSGGVGRGHRQQYSIDLSKAPKKDEKRTKSPVIPKEKSGHFVNAKADILSTQEDVKADILSNKSGHPVTEKRTFPTIKADISGFTYKEEPSIEPSVVTAAEIFEKTAGRKISIQETELLDAEIQPAHCSLWAAFLRTWFASYPNTKNFGKLLPAFKEHLAQSQTRTQNQGLPYNPKTHYADGREKPQGIKGFVC